MLAIEKAKAVAIMSLIILIFCALQASGSAGADLDKGTKDLAAGAKVVSASEIKARILSGSPVEYDNVTVMGSLDLSSLDGPVEQRVSLTNSRIMEDANFEGTTFSKTLKLQHSEFMGNVTFRKARFLEDASLEMTSFKGEADFSEARFGGLAAFTGAEFLKDTSFNNARLNGDAIFLGSKFMRDVEFDFVQFSQLTSFWSAQFEKGTSFTNAQLDGISNFGNAQFLGNTSFAATRFNGDVIFRSARFINGTTFGLASFGGFADFANVDFEVLAFFGLAKFADNAHFTNANLKRGLILEGSRFYSMQLENAVFGPGAQLNLNNSDFTKFMVRWDTINDLLVFNGAAYLALVKNYKNLEWFDDADDCYYQYRRISQETEPWGWTKFVDIIAWLSCGYGVRVSYSIFWCLFTIIFFGVILWAGNGMRKFEFEGLELPGISEIKPSTRVSLIDAMYFSTAMFTTSQAPVNTYPVGFYRHLAMLEGILGWFFLGLFVVVLSSMLIR